MANWDLTKTPHNARISVYCIILTKGKVSLHVE